METDSRFPEVRVRFSPSVVSQAAAPARKRQIARLVDAIKKNVLLYEALFDLTGTGWYVTDSFEGRDESIIGFADQDLEMIARDILAFLAALPSMDSAAIDACLG